jgi:hypothetical protein
MKDSAKSLKPAKEFGIPAGTTSTHLKKVKIRLKINAGAGFGVLA